LPELDAVESEPSFDLNDIARLLGLLALPFVGIALGAGCLLATASDRFDLVAAIGGGLLILLAIGGLRKRRDSRNDVGIIGLLSSLEFGSGGDYDSDFD
jgi:hypothetical protein